MAQNNGISYTESIRPAMFAHVVYRTRRFAEMLEWYKTVFDARVQYRNEALAFLTYDEEHHRFAFADMNVLQPNGGKNEGKSEIGVDHVAYTYASLHDLLETFARLREKDIDPYWSVHHGITVSLYYADPDGNQMEFQVDCFGSSEESKEFIDTFWDGNPVGVEFEPDEWLEKLRSGVPEAELLVRRRHEPVSPIRGRIAELL